MYGQTLVEVLLGILKGFKAVVSSADKTRKINYLKSNTFERLLFDKPCYS